MSKARTILGQLQKRIKVIPNTQTFFTNIYEPKRKNFKKILSKISRI